MRQPKHSLKEQWKMFKYLWGRVLPDAKLNIFIDFIMNPQKLKQRYDEELKFQDKMGDHWK